MPLPPIRWRIKNNETDRTVFYRFDHRLIGAANMIAAYWADNSLDGDHYRIQKWAGEDGWFDLNPAEQQILDRMVTERVARAGGKAA